MTLAGGDIVRHPLVRKIVEAYDDQNNGRWGWKAPVTPILVPTAEPQQQQGAEATEIAPTAMDSQFVTSTDALSALHRDAIQEERNSDHPDVSTPQNPDSN